MNKGLSVFLMSYILAAPISADELLDPRTRDEDISGTEVSVSVTRDDGGLYHYQYEVLSPTENLGTILTFAIDLSCSGPVDAKTDLSHLGLDTRSISKTGNHVPVAMGGAVPFGVAIFDAAFWGLFAEPGTTRQLVLVSAYGPGPRSYRIVPKMDPVGYDYQTYSSDLDPTVPWTADFTVNGFTRGPACPGEEEPVEMPRFAGTLYPNETETVNALLTYSEPLRDRVHAEEGTAEITLTVHYSDNLDPQTFKVMPQKHNLRGLFNPRPGTSETVTLPLEPGKNKIQLQAKAKFLPPAKMNQEIYGGRRPDMDQDDFEVRVDDADKKDKAPKEKDEPQA